MTLWGGGRRESSNQRGSMAVTIKNKTGMATAAETIAATVPWRDHRTSKSPAKKKSKDDSRRTGSRSTASGMYHFVRALYRNWRTHELSSPDEVGALR